MVDNGYDVSNYVDIDPTFGRLSDFKVIYFCILLANHPIKYMSLGIGSIRILDGLGKTS